MSICVEVVLAWPDHYLSRQVHLPVGSNVAQALEAAKLDHAEHSLAVAIYGVQVQLQQVVNDGQRIELLRPLRVDPKESRRRRAQVKQRRKLS